MDKVSRKRLTENESLTAAKKLSKMIKQHGSVKAGVAAYNKSMKKVALSFQDEIAKISAAQAFRPSPGPKIKSPMKSFVSEKPRVGVHVERGMGRPRMGVSTSMMQVPSKRPGVLSFKDEPRGRSKF